MRNKQNTGSGDNLVRERLLTEALTLFNSKGYASTSVREIVDAAGVSKPALYYYFNSKAGIYLELMTRTFSRFQNIVGQRLSAQGTARERLIGFALAIFDGFAEHIDVVRLIYAIFFGPPQGAPAFSHTDYYDVMLKVAGDMVTEGVESQEFREVNVSDVTWAVVSCMNTVMEEQLCHSPPRVGREELGRMVGLVLDGIKT